VSFASKRGFKKVHFESDNERLVRLLQGSEEVERMYLGSIIQSTKSLLSVFSEYKFTHVKRSDNVVAHCLAQLANTDPNKVWVDNVPIQVHHFYFLDLIS